MASGEHADGRAQDGDPAPSRRRRRPEPGPGRVHCRARGTRRCLNPPDGHARRPGAALDLALRRPDPGPGPDRWPVEPHTAGVRRPSLPRAPCHRPTGRGLSAGTAVVYCAALRGPRPAGTTHSIWARTLPPRHAAGVAPPHTVTEPHQEEPCSPHRRRASPRPSGRRPPGSCCSPCSLPFARGSMCRSFTPVPLTLQVLAVVLSGLILGRGRVPGPGPVPAGHLLGCRSRPMGRRPGGIPSPTYWLPVAFIAAALAGLLAERPRPGAAPATPWRLRRPRGHLPPAPPAGVFVGIERAWALGVAPFIAADAMKVVVASGLAALARRWRIAHTEGALRPPSSLYAYASGFAARPRGPRSGGSSRHPGATPVANRRRIAVVHTASTVPSYRRGYAPSARARGMSRWADRSSRSSRLQPCKTRAPRPPRPLAETQRADRHEHVVAGKEIVVERASVSGGALRSA